jgi:ATP-dependent DNA helicase RecG
MTYLNEHDQITNSIARGLTGIQSETTMKKAFGRLADRDLLEPVPGKRGRSSAWQKVVSAEEAEGETLPVDVPKG